MGKQLGILGGAESGVGAAMLAKQNGWDIWLSDYGQIQNGFKKELEDLEINFEEGQHDLQKLLEMDLIVKSPGVPQNVEVVLQLRKKGIPVISEIDFASRYFKKPIIAVTGTNGKTTTVSLIHHILKTANVNSMLAGNIGRSFSRAMTEQKADVAVLEVSSFQLDDLLSFKPFIAVITNISPDHLDRYENEMKLYANAKYNITSFQDENDHLIYNGQDGNMVELMEQIGVKTYLHPVNEHNIHNLLQSKDGIRYELQLMGRHNMENAGMAISVAKIMNISEDNIALGIKSFAAIEHRMEWVANIDGVHYINDSKATNVDAVYYALEGIQNKIIWIVGGIDKGNEYQKLSFLVGQKVKTIIILSKYPDPIKSSFGNLNIPILQTENTKKAVEYAKSHSNSGDIVLLSPACASFDLFDNYEHRGRAFKEAVLQLKQKHETGNTVH